MPSSPLLTNPTLRALVAIALFTVLHADIRLWTLWNGMIAYLLMGTLMAGEWVVRQRVMKNDA